MEKLQIIDHLVGYDSFINDLAARIACILEKDNNDPEIISQRKAFEMFGRANVERWRRQGKVNPWLRPGKVEYRTSELRLLQRTENDNVPLHADNVSFSDSGT